MTLNKGERVLDRYLVEDLIGEGGMGQVYRGTHERLDLPVALKILSGAKEEGLVERFEREAKLMARVRHPNIVSILDYGFLDDGSPCIAMEFIDGDSLEDRFIARGGFHWREALSYMLGILSGLDAMHQADVLHRDLKPSNIVIAPGRPEIVKLIDFGIARPTGAEETKLTVTGMILGTPRYMAPEQVLFYPMDARTDLYAAGLLFYEMLAGDLPFPGEKLTDVMRRLNEPVRPPMAPGRLPPIPDSISEVLVASLQLNADQRPASAREYSDRLIGIEQQEVQPAEAPSATDPTAARAGVGTEEPRLSSFSFETQSTRPPAEPDKPDEKQKVATLDTLMAAGEEEEERRYLLVAKLPPSRLSNPEERKWLAALTGVDGRSYVMGAQFWLAMQLDPESEESAQGQATRIIEALTKRYGATGRAAHCLVDEGFTFTSASLTGASPLPRELRGLMKELG